MARKFLTGIDLSKNELQNAAVHNLPSAPTSPVKGQMYFNTTGGDNTLYWWDGTLWVSAKGGAAALSYGAVNAETVFGLSRADGVATTVARSDHTHGSPSLPYGAVQQQVFFGQSASTGSSTDLARADHLHGTPAHDGNAHGGIPLNAMGSPNGTVNMGGQLVANVASPSSSGDAANKAYVDNTVAGLSWKAPVVAATTANVTLSGLQTIDGVPISAGWRVLVKDQTTASQNGIYNVLAGAWTRATDADSSSELTAAAAFIQGGTLYSDTAWTQTADSPTVGSTNIVWVQFAGGGAVTAGDGLTQVGNTINVITDVSLYTTANLVGRANLAGDVTAAAGSVNTTIAADVVTNTKLANMAAHTFKGNNTAATADPIDLNITQMQAELFTTNVITNTALVDMPAYTIKGNNNGTTGDPVDLTKTAFATMMAGTLGRIFVYDIPASTVVTVAHNLNLYSVMVQVMRVGGVSETVECDVERPDQNNVVLRFAVAPAAGEYRAIVVG